MLYKKLFLLFFLLFNQANCSEPTELLLNSVAAHNPVEFLISNSNNKILINLAIEKGWHVYANQKGDIGYPFKLEITKSVNLANYQVHFSKAKKLELGFKKDIAYVYINNAQIKIDLEAIEQHQPIEIDLELEYGACRNICMVFNEHLRYVVEPHINNQSDTPQSFDYLKKLLVMVFFAIIGGFILNFMPCVLPVLSIKILSIIKSKKFDYYVTKKELFFTVIGIISTFLMLAIMVVIFKSLGQTVGWGMHFHEPIFLMILIIILIIWANVLWSELGANIKLPDWFLNKLLYLSERNLTYVNSFTSGVLATLLATPCLAPFISTTVAFAITQEAFTIFLIYGSIGLGMALPYILMIIVPQLLRLFPKPGKWMIVFKKIMAVSLLSTAFWLLYVLFSQLKISSFLSFLVIIIVGKSLLFRLLYKKKVMLSLILLAIILSFCLNKYYQQQQLALNVLWMPYDSAKLRELLQEKKIVLLDVTASWCINCHYNKYFIFKNKNLLKFLDEEKVILMKADYTKRSEQIVQLLKSYHRPGIPLDIIYCLKYKGGLVLPELLSIDDIVSAIKSCH